MSQQNRSYYVYAYLRSRDSERGPRLSPYYIGKGSGHRAYGKKRSIAKPSDNSYIVFLEEGLTECEAFALEKYAIALYGRIDKGEGILWNMTDGGEGCSGVIMSQETRDKIAQSLMGRKRPRSVTEKMLQSRAGFRHSEETKRKMSKTRKGMKRQPHTPESKLKISQNKAKYEYEITDPDGNTYITRSLNWFCKDHGLHQAHMSATAHGGANGYKGWQVRIIQDLRADPGGNQSDCQWHTSDEVKAQRKEQKRLYDKARRERIKAEDCN
jgi:hypothetical protein